MPFINKQEFQDAICMRYGGEINGTLPYCACREKNYLIQRTMTSYKRLQPHIQGYHRLRIENKDDGKIRFSCPK